MKRITSILVVAAILVALCGCGDWKDGSYASVTPHAGGNSGMFVAEQQAASYSQLCKALVNLVKHGSQQGIIFLYDLSETVVRSYMDAAIRFITTEDPVGAYAVDEVDYEIGMNAGRYAVAVNITYSRSRSEILQIKNVSDLKEAAAVIGTVLEQSGTFVVLRIEEYTNVDFLQLVENYAQNNSHLVMEKPQVMTAVYPESGDSRLVVLTFTYQTEQAMLKRMKELVHPVFLSAELYVQGAPSTRGKLSQLYSFLMERHEYRYEKSVTPAYSLLQNGEGDSYAFACVYAGMCTQSGLDCIVISGTRNGEPWFWNRVTLDETSYYVDLLRCKQLGGFQLYRQSDLSDYHWSGAAI